MKNCWPHMAAKAWNSCKQKTESYAARAFKELGLLQNTQQKSYLSHCGVKALNMYAMLHKWPNLRWNWLHVQQL